MKINKGIVAILNPHTGSTTILKGTTRGQFRAVQPTLEDINPGSVVAFVADGSEVPLNNYLKEQGFNRFGEPLRGQAGDDLTEVAAD